MNGEKQYFDFYIVHSKSEATDLAKRLVVKNWSVKSYEHDIDFVQNVQTRGEEI